MNHNTCDKHGYGIPHGGTCYYCSKEHREATTVSVPQKGGTILNTDHRRRVMIGYLQSKVEDGDWHAVADAAMDLREIEVEARLAQKFEQREG
jgi:hypothetical protein